MHSEHSTTHLWFLSLFPSFCLFSVIAFFYSHCLFISCFYTPQCCILVSNLHVLCWMSCNWLYKAGFLSVCTSLFSQGGGPFAPHTVPVQLKSRFAQFLHTVPRALWEERKAAYWLTKTFIYKHFDLCRHTFTCKLMK